MEHHKFCFVYINDSLFAVSQSVTLFISLFIVSDAFAMLLLESVMNEDSELKRVVSSAYVMKINSLLDLCMSFMNIMKSNGPRMEPCGTHFPKLNRLEPVPFIFTYLALFVR